MIRRRTGSFLRIAFAVFVFSPAVSFAYGFTRLPELPQDLSVQTVGPFMCGPLSSHGRGGVLEVRGKRDAEPAKNAVTRKEHPQPSDAAGLPEAGGAGTIAVIRGSVAITGNEPHTRVVMVDASTGETYYVVPEDTMELMRGLQGALADFTVRLLDESAAEGKIDLAKRTVNPLSWKIIR